MSYISEYQPITNNKYWTLPKINIFGIMIHSIGSPQPSAQIMRDYFNRPTTAASIHGIIEPGRVIYTLPCLETHGRARLAYHCGPGSKGSYNQSRMGLEMTEPNTLKYTGGATFTDSDPVKTKQFIKDVTATTAEVVADLCIFHNLGVNSITTHRQANLAGYATAHMDPDHIWDYIGYGLEQFKQDIQTIINERKDDYIKDMNKQEFEEILDKKFAEFEEKLTEKQMPTYNYFEDIPEWGKAAISKALDKKLIIGAIADKDKKVVLNISYDLLRTIVILDRAGLFDKVETPIDLSQVKV